MAVKSLTTGRSGWLTTGLLVLLGVVPLLSYYGGEPFYLDLATRLVVLAIAASSLNLLLGYGGMISFGHAVYIGIGAYAVGIPVYHATYGEFDLIASYSGFFHIALAVAASGLFALITGAICLRTRGVHFIMITMAFGQMIYYLFVSMETYGGDDGLTIDVRSEFPGLDFDNPVQLYLVCFAVLAVVLYAIHRITNSRFGMVLRGAMANEERMRALGYNTYAYKLTAYVISGIICGLAGVLMANFSTFISPEMIDWTRSGELLFMVILGGAGTIAGPVLGSFFFIAVEHFLPAAMDMFYKGAGVYWHLPFGILLILLVLFARRGLMGLLVREKAHE
ncbi:MAG TPA: branched-chain amino acid ABC transporter permease [Rhizobiales bacterium]|nr:branched-chain amino acid ABC transporter permease [Hyphomicrobiales bacterium]